MTTNEAQTAVVWPVASGQADCPNDHRAQSSKVQTGLDWDLSEWTLNLHWTRQQIPASIYEVIQDKVTVQNITWAA